MGGSYDEASQHEPGRTTPASDLIVRLRRVLQPEGLDCACRETLDGALDRFDQLERRREARREGLSTIEAAGLVLARLEGRPEIETAVTATFRRMLERYDQAAGAAPAG